MSDNEFGIKARALLDEVQSLSPTGKNNKSRFNKCFVEFQELAKENGILKKFNFENEYRYTFNYIQEKMKNKDLSDVQNSMVSHLSSILGNW